MTPHAPQLRALVEAQLRLDFRHPKTGRAQTSRVALTVGSYAFSAVVLALSLAERGASFGEVLGASVAFTAVLAAFGVAGSYDDLMGRPRDHAQHLTFPVSEATLYAARLVNVGLFALAMSVSAALPLAVLGIWSHGAAAGLALGATLVGTMLAVTLTVLATVWGLTLTAPARFLRTALSASRALLIGALVLGYQWVGMGSDLPASVALGSSPVAWAGLAALLLGLAALFGAFFPGRYLRILRRTAEAEQGGPARRPGRVAPRVWERWAARRPEVRAAYGFAAAALQGDRLVRGRVWPAAGLAFVFSAFAWWTGGLGDIFAHGAQHVLLDPAIQMHLSVLTILLFVAQSAVQAVQVSDHAEAAWMFDTLPVRSRRALQVGAQQALLLRVLLPLHAVLAGLLALSMPLGHAVLHAAFWLAGCALLTRTYALTRREPPLSRRSDRFSAGERFLPLLISIPFALVLLLLQSLTFTQPLSAALMVAGLFTLHAAMGHLPSPAPSARDGHALHAPAFHPDARG